MTMVSMASKTEVHPLLAAGVPREVGALVAAHLGAANASIYEACPSCAAGPLKARAAEPQFSDLLLVELDRGAALAPEAAGRLPRRRRAAAAAAAVARDRRLLRRRAQPGPAAGALPRGGP